MNAPVAACRQLGWVIVFLVLVGIGAFRIVSTYHVFSQTTDEPAHLATGMEWLQRGTYTLEPLHPPLARVAIALGPYLSGSRMTGGLRLWDEGNGLLLANGRYLHNLSLARLGVLPFFFLATFLVCHWAWTHYGKGPAVLATILFTSSPVVLAHSGLATTDMALAATFTAALLAYVRLLERPTYPRAALFGAATALAILSKFSALLFLPACAGAILLCRRLVETRQDETAIPQDRFRWSKGLLLAGVVICLMVWAGYRFAVGSITEASARPHSTIDHLVGVDGKLHNAVYAVAEARWLPAPPFFRGLAALRAKNAEGHKGYLLGHIRRTGWWYFFPLALAVKTTLPLLLLSALGFAKLASSAWKQKDWAAAAPAVSALALILVCLPSHINIGVRHILPIYPVLAIIGGVGGWWLWQAAWPKHAGPVLLVLLIGWHVASSIRAHPDYLSYFNQLAGHHPENILIDSDLDWGQDLLRLSATLRQKHIQEVSIAYAGSMALDLGRFDLPPFRILAPHQPTAGWIAISLLRLKTGGFGLPADSFTWLEAYQPVALVGHSIRLYHIPEAAISAPPERVDRPPEGTR